MDKLKVFSARLDKGADALTDAINTWLVDNDIYGINRIEAVPHGSGGALLFVDHVDQGDVVTRPFAKVFEVSPQRLDESVAEVQTWLDYNASYNVNPSDNETITGDGQGYYRPSGTWVAIPVLNGAAVYIIAFGRVYVDA